MTSLLGVILLTTATLLSPQRVRAALAPIPNYLLTEAKPQGRAYLRHRFKIEPEMNSSIQYYVEQFSGQFRDRFTDMMQREAVYRTLIEDILVNHGLPAELSYLAMIESGFNVAATSPASAVGIWQFMRSTARHYGLRVDSQVDERHDPIRSTQAAARYLRDLHHEFHSWYLAMAAYNAGAGRVRRAMRQCHTRDFWTLVHRGGLPHETAQYVPQFQAAMAISRNPAQYGFRPRTPLQYPKLKRIHVSHATSFVELARLNRMSAPTLRSLNPQLLHGSERLDGRYWVWVPLGSNQL